jgi:hypothetical protein
MLIIFYHIDKRLKSGRKEVINKLKRGGIYFQRLMSEASLKLKINTSAFKWFDM